MSTSESLSPPWVPLTQCLDFFVVSSLCPDNFLSFHSDHLTPLLSALSLLQGNIHSKLPGSLCRARCLPEDFRAQPYSPLRSLCGPFLSRVQRGQGSSKVSSHHFYIRVQTSGTLSGETVTETSLGRPGNQGLCGCKQRGCLEEGSEEEQDPSLPPRPLELHCV